MPRWLFALLMSVLLVSCSAASDIEGEPWSTLRDRGALHTGDVADDGTLRVSGSASKVHVATLDASEIKQATWTLRGRVRHDLRGDAHLEMWSVLSDGSRYFTKGLAAEGPTRSMSGASGWRPFILPFFSKPDSPSADKIELYVVFVGSGHVDLGPVALKGHGPGEDPMAAQGAWWTSRDAGMLGGGFGALLGCLGAFVGIMAGRGRSRTMVLSVLVGSVVIGVLLLTVGLGAWIGGQPFQVVYPVVLTGGLATIVFSALLPVIRRRYAQVERRKMTALDA